MSPRAVTARHAMLTGRCAQMRVADAALRAAGWREMTVANPVPGSRKARAGGWFVPAFEGRHRFTRLYSEGKRDLEAVRSPLSQ